MRARGSGFPHRRPSLPGGGFRPAAGILWFCPGGTGRRKARRPAAIASVPRTRQTRNPLFRLRSSGLFLLRLAERQFLAVLFQEPPRRTRVWFLRLPKT